MIDTLERGKINIKEFSFSEPMKKFEAPFDPMRDVSMENWQETKKSIIENWNTSAFEGFILLAARAVVLFPERRHEIDLHATSADDLLILPTMVQGLENEVQGVANVKLLFPNDFLNREYMPRLKSIDNIIRHSAPSILDPESIKGEALSNLIFNTYILYPERIHELKSDELKAFFDKSSKRPPPDGTFALGSYAMDLVNQKLLYPENSADISDETWEMMKNALRSTWNSRLAVNMKLLAAEKIEMTDKGLVITMPGQKNVFENKGRELPERRKF
jgi:hypothetical protein